MLNLGSGDPEDAPFAGNAVWIPITTVHLRVPELNQLPTFWIRKDGAMLLGGRTLDRYGLPSFRIGPSLKVDDPYAGAVASASQPLAGRNDAYVRFQVKYGVVALTVNGYRVDDQDLKHLINTAAHVAHNLVASTQPAAGEFAAFGPAAGSQRPPEGVPLPHPGHNPAYATAAGNLGMLQENPHYLAHLLPRCPIPGIASGVLFGTLPGGTVGRMVWFEHGGAAWSRLS